MIAAGVFLKVSQVLHKNMTIVIVCPPISVRINQLYAFVMMASNAPPKKASSRLAETTPICTDKDALSIQYMQSAMRPATEHLHTYIHCHAY